MRIGALEAGGTKMVCAIGDEDGNILEQISIPTTDPVETMEQVAEYYKDKNISGLGIGAFGPVNVKEGTPDYGAIQESPKLRWRGFNFVTFMEERLHIPVGIDTDVNGSCLGELTYGCGKGLQSLLYITIGTGIGCGIAINGKLLHGMLHPEAGHILIQKKEKDLGQSVCPYHSNCFEGLAAGPAIEARYGKPAVALVDREEVWELESDYIAQALMNYILTIAPEKIVLGGGVMHQEQLFPLIRKKVVKLLNGYITTTELSDIDHYIVPASLHDDQGIMGAVRIGLEAIWKAKKA